MNLYIDHPGTKIHAHLFWTQKRSLFIQAARYCCPNGTPVLRQSTKIHLGRSWPTWGFPYNDGTPLSLVGSFHGESQSNSWMITRGTPILGNLHIVFNLNLKIETK
jgi:hypothetical protein